MNEVSVERRVIGLVEHHLTKSTLVRPDMLLYQDLHFYGDDADELLEAFATCFDVDMYGFQFTDYFRSEGMTPVDIVLIIRRLFGYQDFSKKPIAIGHLVEVASLGKWFDPHPHK